MNNDVVMGDTQQWVIYIKVRWVFLIFPVVTLVCGVIFSFGIAYDTHKQKLEKMKSGTLAVMLHGFDGDTRELLRAEKKDGNPTGNVIVQLEDGKLGLSLRSGL